MLYHISTEKRDILTLRFKIDSAATHVFTLYVYHKITDVLCVQAKVHMCVHVYVHADMCTCGHVCM